MEARDERPISVYDNLSTPTYLSAPKTKVQTQLVPPNGGGARYREISFKFDNGNDNNSKLKANEQQLQTANRSPAQAQQVQLSAPQANATSSHIEQRPLSIHSQSELNEACQSLAAVKAALNDAKSKFFGLNGYAQDNTSSHIDATRKLLPNIKPQVQIVTPNASTPPAEPATAPVPAAATIKSQPKYQNIPENSAIYRQNQPPERPPKPGERQTTAPTINQKLEESGGELNTMPIRAQSPTSQQIKLPTTYNENYKQVPLNDIDSSHPSQAVYMSTTVPQNIKGSKIAGRHTPTRNSLRHSRMLVVNNRNYQGAEYPNPMNFKQPNLARTLLILQIIIGVAICFLSVWLFVLAPNTPMQDNPYWSGLALLLAGMLGLGLIRFQRIKRQKVRENFFLFVRANSLILSLLAIILCSIALICASIHFLRITANDTKCESTNILIEHSSCVCTFNYRNQTDTGTADRSYKVEYRDFSCQEIRCEWTYILGFSVVLNLLGLLLSVVYLALVACCRHSTSKRFYSSVHTSTF